MATKKRTAYKKKSYQISKKNMDQVVDSAIADYHFSKLSIEEIKAIASLKVEDLGIEEIATSTNPEDVEKAYAKLAKKVNEFIVTEDTTIEDLINIINSERNNADKSYSLAKNDIVAVWSQSIYSENPVYSPASWVSDPVYGEKFLSFAEKGERFIYTGYKNQMLLASALEYGTEVNVTVTKTDIEKLVNENFQPDPNSDKSETDQRKSNFFAAIKGKPSISSIYVPKVYEQYYMPDGSKWKSSNPKVRKPTQEQIKALNINVHENVSYLSTPVWSVEQFKEYLSDDKSKALDNLLEERMPPKFLKKFREPKTGEVKQLAQIVEDRIQEVIKQQNIEVNENNTANHYLPAKDKIYMIGGDRFTSPVMRYRTFMHEIGHSTKHLLGRKLRRTNNESEVRTSLVEEIVAESIAYLATKSLERDLKADLGDDFPKDWEQMFRDTFHKNNSYINSYACDERIRDEFKQIESDVREGDFTILEDVMKSVLQAQQLIKNGTLNGKEITKELRVTKLKENYKKWDKDKIKSASALELN